LSSFNLFKFVNRYHKSMSRNFNDRPPNTSLYVKNIPDETLPDDLRDLFSKYGNLSDVYIPMDYYTKRPRGFAYVQFEDPRDAEDAVESVDGKRLFGFSLEVQFAKGDRKSPGQMRGKDPVSQRERYSRNSRHRRSRSRSRSGERRRRDSRRDRDRDRDHDHDRDRDRDRDGGRRRRRDDEKRRSRSRTKSKSKSKSKSPEKPAEKSRSRTPDDD